MLGSLAVALGVAISTSQTTINNNPALIDATTSGNRMQLQSRLLPTASITSPLQKRADAVNKKAAEDRERQQQRRQIMAADEARQKETGREQKLEAERQAAQKAAQEAKLVAEKEAALLAERIEKELEQKRAEEARLADRAGLAVKRQTEETQQREANEDGLIDTFTTKGVMSVAGLGVVGFLGSTVFSVINDLKKQEGEKASMGDEIKSIHNTSTTTVPAPPSVAAATVPKGVAKSNRSLIAEIDDVLKDVEGVLDEVNVRLMGKGASSTEAEAKTAKEAASANMVEAILKAELQKAEVEAERQREILAKAEQEGILEVPDATTAEFESPPSLLDTVLEAELKLAQDESKNQQPSPIDPLADPLSAATIAAVLEAELRTAKEEAKAQDLMLQAEQSYAEESGVVSSSTADAILAAELANARDEAKRQEELLRAERDDEAARSAAEEDARLETERVKAEKEARAAVEEANRAAAEEEDRLEAERVKANEEARLEAEREEFAEKARLEAERIRAEEEAARVKAEEEAEFEAERKKAADAALLEAERVKAAEEARLEAERVKAEEEARAEAGRLQRAAEETRIKAMEDMKLLDKQQLALDEANLLYLLDDERSKLDAIERMGDKQRSELVSEFRNAVEAAEAERAKAIETAEVRRLEAVIAKRIAALEESQAQLQMEEANLLNILSSERRTLIMQQGILAGQRAHGVMKYQKAVVARRRADKEAKLKAIAKAQEAKRVALLESKINLQQQEARLLGILSSESKYLAKEESLLAKLRSEAVANHQLATEIMQEAERSSQFKAIEEARAAALVKSEAQVSQDTSRLLSTLSVEQANLGIAEKALADTRAKLVAGVQASKEAQLEEARKAAAAMEELKRQTKLRQEQRRQEAEKKLERVRRGLLVARLETERRALLAEQKRLEAEAEAARLAQLLRLAAEAEEQARLKAAAKQAQENAEYEKRLEPARRSLLAFRLNEQKKSAVEEARKSAEEEKAARQAAVAEKEARENALYEKKVEKSRRSLLSCRLDKQRQKSLMEQAKAEATAAFLEARLVEQKESETRLTTETQNLLGILRQTNALVAEEERVMAAEWAEYVAEYQRIFKEEEEKLEAEEQSEEDARLAELQRLEAELLVDTQQDGLSDTKSSPDESELDRRLKELEQLEAELLGGTADDTDTKVAELNTDASDVDNRVKELEKLEAELGGTSQVEDVEIVDSNAGRSELEERLKELEQLERELLAEVQADNADDVVGKDATTASETIAADPVSADKEPEKHVSTGEVEDETFRAVIEAIQKADELFVPTEEALSSPKLLLDQVTGSSLKDYTGKEGVFSGRNIAVSAGSSLSVPVRVSTPGTFVEFVIKNKGYEFGFGITAFLDDNNAIVVVKEMGVFGRQASIQDKVLVAAGSTPCTLQFKFENNKQTMLEKVQLTYHIRVVPPSPTLARDGRRRRARATLTKLDEDSTAMQEQLAQSLIQIPKLQFEIDNLTKELAAKTTAMQAVALEEKKLRQAMGISENAVVRFSDTKKASPGLLRPNEL